MCETWLKSSELCAIKHDLTQMNLCCQLKSSIDPEMLLEGCPYYGVGRICREIPGVSYIPLNSENDRIYAVQIVVKTKVQMTIGGIYMPHYTGAASQINLYSQTLEDIQCIIDTNDPSPVLFSGDMNASMPKSQQLSTKWYRSHPFTRHSLLLYDFACQHVLYCCNYDYPQRINYTYSTKCY